MHPLAIGVVGAGTAGAAAGTLLARAGHRVTVFERIENPQPVGAGITLQPTGQAALHRLGLLEEVVARGSLIERLTCVRSDRKPMVDMPYAEIHHSLRGLGTHRGNLFTTLFAALRGSGATLRCSAHISSTSTDADGRWLTLENGERCGPFDLVIAADGGVSELHGCAKKVKSTAYPWGALWIVAPDTADFTGERRIYQIIEGAHTMLGFLPTGLAPGTSTKVVSLFWSIRADRVDDWKRAGLAPWRDRVLRLEPRAEAILDSITDPAQILFAKYRDVAMSPWHADKIVFIGDAAHATSPQLGQGANLALIDAVAIADAIASIDDRAHPAFRVRQAVLAYSLARKHQLGFYQFMTRFLTPFFQSDSKLRALVRDLTFPHSRWIGPLRRQMTQTMVGVGRGFLRPAFPIHDLPRLRAP